MTDDIETLQNMITSPMVIDAQDRAIINLLRMYGINDEAKVRRMIQFLTNVACNVDRQAFAWHFEEAGNILWGDKK